MNVLEIAGSLGLHIVVWFNKRGVFLTVHTEKESEVDEEMLVDAVRFENEIELRSFASENIDAWVAKQNGN